MPEPAPPLHHEPTHNHQQCIDTALASAKQLCIKKSVNLTPVREQVLTIILQSHQPSGAYSILDTLAEAAEPGAKPAPPTVYRALEFLLDQQLIHRITSLNAYIACCRPARSHKGHFLICQVCRQAVELNSTDISEAINSAAQKQGFAVAHEGLEVFGTCAECHKQLETRIS
jgi:Fur family zinc uptake transcriptional regulator